jgi:hypothetical protein
MNPIEYIGLIASIIVFISFTFKDPVKIRIVNSIGTIIFTYYAVMMNTVAIFVLNFGLLTLQAIYIIKALKARKGKFATLTIPAPDSCVKCPLTYGKYKVTGKGKGKTEVWCNVTGAYLFDSYQIEDEYILGRSRNCPLIISCKENKK